LNRNLVEAVIKIDSDDTSHIVRIILLIDVFAGKNKTGKIEGIIKLAIFDFLLRYPVALNRALEAQEAQGNKNEKRFKLQSYEMNSIDARMMKFNFAPWDFKYRRIISILKAKNLIEIEVIGKKSILRITTNGVNAAKRLQHINNYDYLIARCRVIKSLFGNWSQKRLIDMIYKTFPEILTFKVETDVVL